MTSQPQRQVGVAGQTCPLWPGGRSLNQHADTKVTSDKTQTDKTETPCMILAGGRTSGEQRRGEIRRPGMGGGKDKGKGLGRKVRKSKNLY